VSQPREEMGLKPLALNGGTATCACGGSLVALNGKWIHDSKIGCTEPEPLASPVTGAPETPAQDQQAEIDRLRTQLRRTSDLVHGLHKAGLICDEEASYLASDSEQSGKSKDLQIEAVDTLRLREAVVMAEQWFYDRGYTAMCEILRAALAPRKAS
jgi:hypothetical protein